MIRPLSLLVAAAVVCGVGATTARADTIDVFGNIYAGLHARVTFNYAAVNANEGLASITIENLTNPLDPVNPTQGVVTAFAFNVPTAVTGYVVPTNLGPNWTILPEVYAQNTIGPPQSFGFFDVGGEAGSNDQFNGNTNFGIQEGDSRAFSIGLTGVGMNTLTTSDFLSLLSAPATNPQGKIVGNDTLVAFAVRFQDVGVGTRTGLSDVAVPGDTPMVPEPGTWALMGVIAGAGYMLRRRRA